jgi:glucose-1-phosphate adenylyltransferase
MDFGPMLRQHRETGAAVTISAKPMGPELTRSFGLMAVDAERHVKGFIEKPQEEAQRKGYELPETLRDPDERGPVFAASMGIYVFRYEVLLQLLENTDVPDFGRDVLPEAVRTTDVRAFLFRGYWEDIGTIRAFFEANLALASPDPPFVFHTLGAPIYTAPRFLGPSRLEGCSITNTMMCDGCYLHGREIRESVIGIRTVVMKDASVVRSVVMGADGYEGDLPRQPGDPPLGIGHGCDIEGAIIDKNARIGDGVRIRPKPAGTYEDHPYYFVRDGIVVIPKNYAVPAGVQI